MNEKPTTPPRVLTLSLVVKYDDVVSVDEVMEAAKELVDKAREYGEVTMARLDNLPDSVDLG